MKKVWVGLIALVVVAPARPEFGRGAAAPAPNQDMLEMTEKELHEIYGRLQKTYVDFLDGKADRKVLEEDMKQVKFDIKKRSWENVQGDALLVEALKHYSDSMWERASWLQPQGSAATLKKDTVNWDRLHDVEIARLKIRVRWLELRKQ